MTKETEELQKKLVTVLTEQVELQQKLIAAQNQIQDLQSKIIELTPSKVDTDVNWNKVYGGLSAEEVLRDGDLAAVKALREWIFKFGEKYLKPYINHKAYAETMAHMSRGIADKLANLEVEDELNEQGDLRTLNFDQIKSKKDSKPTTINPQQKRLLED